MIWIDFIIIGVIALSALISLIRGFVREALSLVAWVLAFWVAWTFFRELSLYFQDSIGIEEARLGLAFVILLVATLVVGGIVNFLVRQLVDATGLTGTDRLLGIFFGAARGALLVAVMVLLAGLTPLPESSWWRDSTLIVYFQELAVWLKQLHPDDIADLFKYA